MSQQIRSSRGPLFQRKVDRSRVSGLVLVLLLIFSCLPALVSAQDTGLFPGLSALSESDVQRSSIAFVNMTTSPGLEGVTLRIDQDNRQSEQWRSSLGFNAEFTLKEPVFNGYWGLAVVGGGLDDTVELIADNGNTVTIDLERDVVALRGSLGLSFPVDQRLKIRPVLSLVVADLQTQGSINGLFSIGPGIPTTFRFNTSAQFVSTVAGLNALYARWYGNYKLELEGVYNVVYTDAFSEDNPVLDTEAWDRTVQLKSKFSGATGWLTSGRPWRWNVYANYVNFLSTDKSSLGYTQLVEFGTGLDWHLNIKPLDWFGWRSVGIRAGVTIGSDVEGYTIGLAAQ